ncbi:hypothetical protein O181_032740 [Austropuccinia psidii MF-1]|uniref:Uncharacterized protein n=1 Tax=Austropuccinia psidii MF-1 TaxID=1389203 RepID=A0A9Q3D1M5_9BASI|nr:hypothetical protein [Austropuccinia psidii MF-1]
MEGRKRAKKIKFFLRGKGEEVEENSVEEEESYCTEGVPAPVGASQGTGGPTLAQSDQPVSHQSEPSLLAIMQQMTQIMANIQAASVSEQISQQAKSLSEDFFPCLMWIYEILSFLVSGSISLLIHALLYEATFSLGKGMTRSKLRLGHFEGQICMLIILTDSHFKLPSCLLPQRLILP